VINLSQEQLETAGRGGEWRSGKDVHNHNYEVNITTFVQCKQFIFKNITVRTSVDLIKLTCCGSQYNYIQRQNLHVLFKPNDLVCIW